MTSTLCLRLAAHEPRELIQYLLREPRTVVAVAARHLIARVDVDAADGITPSVWIEAAIERARPVHVRFELVRSQDRVPTGAQLVGSISAELAVYGSYLGPVSDEN